MSAPRREVCFRGHPFTEENTRIKPSGSRSCRKCEAMRAKQYRIGERVGAMPPDFCACGALKARIAIRCEECAYHAHNEARVRSKQRESYKRAQVEYMRRKRAERYGHGVRAL